MKEKRRKLKDEDRLAVQDKEVVSRNTLTSEKQSKEIAAPISLNQSISSIRETAGPSPRGLSSHVAMGPATQVLKLLQI